MHTHNFTQCYGHVHNALHAYNICTQDQEVLGLQVSEQDSDDDSEDEESESEALPSNLRQFYASDDDFEEADNSLEVSEKAWGQSKNTFYSTDYVDDDFGGSSEEEEAEMEEREARAIQQRMAATLDEHDFEITRGEGEREDGLEEVERGKEEKVIQDLSKLSRDEKIVLLEKDSPELFELLEEFQMKFSQAIHTIFPLVQVARQDPGRVSVQGKEYLEVKLNLYLCYCVNVMFYLRLKSCRTPVHNHPVIGRIVQIRQVCK